MEFFLHMWVYYLERHIVSFSLFFYSKVINEIFGAVIQLHLTFGGKDSLFFSSRSSPLIFSLLFFISFSLSNVEFPLKSKNQWLPFLHFFTVAVLCLQPSVYSVIYTPAMHPQFVGIAAAAAMAADAVLYAVVWAAYLSDTCVLPGSRARGL